MEHREQSDESDDLVQFREYPAKAIGVFQSFAAPEVVKDTFAQITTDLALHPRTVRITGFCIIVDAMGAPYSVVQ